LYRTGLAPCYSYGAASRIRGNRSSSSHWSMSHSRGSSQPWHTSSLTRKNRSRTPLAATRPPPEPALHTRIFTSTRGTPGA
jgi:hypothetical protein